MPLLVAIGIVLLLLIAQEAVRQYRAINAEAQRRKAQADAVAAQIRRTVEGLADGTLKAPQTIRVPKDLQPAFDEALRRAQSEKPKPR